MYQYLHRYVSKLNNKVNKVFFNISKIAELPKNGVWSLFLQKLTLDMSGGICSKNIIFKIMSVIKNGSRLFIERMTFLLLQKSEGTY